MCPVCRRIAEEEDEEVIYVAEPNVVVEDGHGADIFPAGEYE